jgi:hypothetical protein
VGHNHLAQAVPLLDRLFQLGVHAAGGDHRGPHDAGRHRLLEQPGDAWLRDVQMLGDLRLAHATLVVHPGNLREQPDVLGGHAGVRLD